MSSSVFSVIPIAVLFIVVLLITYSAVYAGFNLGRRFREHKSEGDAPPLGSVIGALFALLAFMLALTFSSASNRYDTRKQLLVDEVNTIGTVYLRTSFLEEEDQLASQALLKGYVKDRTKIINNRSVLNELIAKSESTHQKLWNIAIKYPKGDVSGAVTAAYINALNEMFDLHSSRLIVGVSYHVHSSIWATLLTISVLSMAALGFQFAYSGGQRVWLCMILATTFSLVLFLIEDLDRPGEGRIRVDHGPMISLHESMSKNE